VSSLPLAFLFALLVSLALTPLCRFIAHRLGCVAKPKEDRWHKRPTALFGGLAIAATVAIVGVGLGANVALWRLFGCGALLAAFGLVDDLIPLKPSTKLIVQIAVGCLVLYLGYRLHWTQSLIGDAMLTLLWIVGVTNAFNLLDNMDGLCAGTALIAGSVLLVGLLRDGGVTPSTVYLTVLLGATLGFLVYNRHPASIFLGDSGSLFLGLNLAAFTLMTTPNTTGESRLLAAIIAPSLPLLLPIFDTTLVTALRLLSGRAPSQGGKDHASHRLVAVGLSEPRAVATLWMLAAAGGGVALLVQQRSQGFGGVTAVLLLLGMIIFGVYLARIRTYDDADSVLQRGAITPVVVTFMYKRRVAEVLLDVVLIALAYYSAYRLRFEGALFAANYRLFLQSLPIVLASQLIALFVVGGYRGTWRYFGMMDAVVFAKGVLAGTVAAQIIILYTYRFQAYSRSVFIIHAALLFLLLAASRGSFRLVGEFVLRRLSSGHRVIVYGTGGASLATIREAFGVDKALRIVGFVDDDPLQRRTRRGGYSVIGDFKDLVRFVENGEVDFVVLNTTLDAERMSALERLCESRDVQLARLQVMLTNLSENGARSSLL
jgi:UDP-GlcNAc:undecaprenyl-phosphate GlcNAc-1-phosphate transferase